MIRLTALLRSALYYLGALALFAAGWDLATRLSINGRQMLPSFVEVVEAGSLMYHQGALLHDIAVSLVRFLLGWTIGSALAIPAGLFTGRYTPTRPAQMNPALPRNHVPSRRILQLAQRGLGELGRTIGRMVAPLVEANFNGLRAIPVIALVSLAFIWWGSGEPTKVFVIAWGVYFPVWVNTHNGVKSVNPNYLNAAMSLGCRGWRLWWRVLLPHISESILVGLRVGIGVGLICVVAAELTGSITTDFFYFLPDWLLDRFPGLTGDGFFREGLGYRLELERRAFNLDRVVACLLAFGVLGLVLDRVFAKTARPLIIAVAGFDPSRSTLRAGTAAQG